MCVTVPGTARFSFLPYMAHYSLLIHPCKICLWTFLSEIHIHQCLIPQSPKRLHRNTNRFPFPSLSSLHISFLPLSAVEFQPLLLPVSRTLTFACMFSLSPQFLETSAYFPECVPVCLRCRPIFLGFTECGNHFVVTTCGCCKHGCFQSTAKGQMCSLCLWGGITVTSICKALKNPVLLGDGGGVLRHTNINTNSCTNGGQPRKAVFRAPLHVASGPLYMIVCLIWVLLWHWRTATLCNTVEPACVAMV